MPFRALSDRGIPIAIGTDERSADDAVNNWAALKQAGLVHQIGQPDYQRWPSPRELLQAATSSGARGMRIGDLGRIAPGYLADIILIDADTLPFTPMNDLRRQLVYAHNGSAVVLTMVAGEVVMRDGRVLTVDEKALRAELRARQPDANQARIRVRGDVAGVNAPDAAGADDGDVDHGRECRASLGVGQ